MLPCPAVSSAVRKGSLSGQAPEPSRGVLGFTLLVLPALARGSRQSSGWAPCPPSFASPASPNPLPAFEEAAPERGDGI